MQGECLICKAPLGYLVRDEAMEGVICHKEEASKVAWQILMFASSLALVISIIFIAFHDPLLRLMFGQIEADVMQSA